MFIGLIFMYAYLIFILDYAFLKNNIVFHEHKVLCYQFKHWHI